MKIKRLKYYGKKATYPKKAITLPGNFEPSDRDILSFIQESKPIIIDGIRYYPEHIYAEPRKKSVLGEICLFILLMGIYWYFNVEKITVEKVFLSEILSMLAGSLIGLIRIDSQRRKADKFNAS